MSLPLHISDYGVLLPAGNHPGALLAAVLAGQACTRIEDTLMVPTANGPAVPVTARPPTALPGLLEHARTLLAPWQDTPVLLVLPDPTHTRYRRLLAALDPALGPHCHLTSPRQLAEALTQQLQHLHAGEHSVLTVLALDDLLTQDALLALNQTGTLRTDQQPLGRAPAQGMAWFRLCADDPGTGDTVIRWLGHSASEEPNADQIGSAPLLGLANAVTQCLAHDAAPERPEVVVHARAQTQAEQLEWYHARQRVWPNDQHLPAMELLCPALTCGDLGAASLVAGVVTACERLRFPLKPATDTLVVDSAEQGSRIALALSRSPTRSSS